MSLFNYINRRISYHYINKFNTKYCGVTDNCIKMSSIKFNNFIRFRYCNQLNYTLPYALSCPKNVPRETKLPLFIFLHGSDCGGESAIFPLIQGNNCINKIDKNNNYILVPSLPKTLSFKTKIDNISLNGINGFDKIFTDLLNHVIHKYAIDENKINLIGISDGGMGVLTQLCLHPDRYASAIAISGNVDFTNFDSTKLCTTPLWLVHSETDKVVPISYDENGHSGSDIIYEKISRIDDRPLKYSRYETRGHKISKTFLNNIDWYNWCLMQNRQDFMS